MTPIQIKVFGFGILAVFIIVIMVLTRKKVLSFLYPNDYIIVEMLELDNSVSSWIEKKNDKLRFEFNKGYYNMFHQSIDKDGKISIDSAIYREGRLAKFFYHEGSSDPLDYRLGKVTGNPQIAKQLETLNISELFEEDLNPFEEFLKKYGILIVIVILIIVLAVVLKKPAAVTPVITKGG